MSVLVATALVARPRKGAAILDGMSLRLDRGDAISIQGPSGAGKSTLLRILAGLDDPESGTIELDGVSWHQMPASTYRTRVGYVPQRPLMFDGTVLQNLRAGPAYSGAPFDAERAKAQLEAVGLRGFEERVARQLSGGEQHRVALVRALANDPVVLLLDEPTAALDPTAASRVIDFLRALARAGLAIVIVTHVEEHAIQLSNRAYRIEDGHLTDARGAGRA